MFINDLHIKEDEPRSDSLLELSELASIHIHACSIVASDVPGGNRIRRIKTKAQHNALRIAISKID